MATERLKSSTLVHSLSNVVADFADLIQKEMRLARAEISEKISTKVRAVVWMAVTALLAFVAILLLVEGVVIWIATLGFSLAASCLIVASVLGALAALAYFAGQADARESLAPERTIHQVNQDINQTKEHLT